MIDFYDIIAKERGVPADWRWFKIEAKGDGAHVVFLLTGAVPNGVISRGKYKGKPKYDKSTQRELVITRAELDAAHDTWERETGKCYRCNGTGKVITSAHANGERTYRDCRRCDGTSKRVSP